MWCLWTGPELRSTISVPPSPKWRVTARGTIGIRLGLRGKMEMMRVFWDAAVELNPDAAK
jgi:hypothetical protein